jgi:hypothetical protein
MYYNWDIHTISKDIFKGAWRKGHLLFRLKPRRSGNKNSQHFVISGQCLNFIDSELRQPQYDARRIDYIEDFDVIYSNLSLIRVTCWQTDRKREVDQARLFLRKKGIFPIAYRTFVNSYCILLDHSDSAKALGYLHDGIRFNENVSVTKVGVH